MGGNAGGGFRKRAFDYGTAGGNAYSGSSSSTSSGSVSNVADSDTDISNTASSKCNSQLTYTQRSHIFTDIGPAVVTTGDDGPTSESFTGAATGGDGDGFGPGGNAYTGASGPSNGGFVFNEGNDITNTGSSTFHSVGSLK